MVLSNMSEEGENSSFSIDMFDPSKVDASDPNQHPSLPVHQLQEIGAGDFLPSAGMVLNEILVNTMIFATFLYIEAFVDYFQNAIYILFML